MKLLNRIDIFIIINTVNIVKNIIKITTPVLKNPQMTAKLVSANTGGTTAVAPKCASMAIFTEGMSKRLDPRFAKGNSFTNYNSTTPAPVLAIKTRRVFTKILKTVDLLPANFFYSLPQIE